MINITGETTRQRVNNNVLLYYFWRVTISGQKHINITKSECMVGNSKLVATALLSLGAVKLSPSTPYTYASGLVGPIYCDNRILLSFPEKRDFVINSFIDLILKCNLQFDVVGGVATAGIPYAAIVADRLKKPLIYVRSRPKTHGKGNQIEGDLPQNSKVLLFEDLINQGGSSFEAVQAIRDAGSSVPVLLSVVHYGMKKATELFEKEAIVVHSLTNFNEIVSVAKTEGLITEHHSSLLFDWQKDPVHWDKIARKL